MMVSRYQPRTIGRWYPADIAAYQVLSQNNNASHKQLDVQLQYPHGSTDYKRQLNWLYRQQR